MEPTSDWTAALDGIDTVVHLAARVHVMRDTATDPLGAFRRINVDGTMNLARQAAAAGVRRFVFVSSLKVNGEAGSYTEADVPAPADPYGVSKWEAERALRDLAGESGLELVVIRPPLVYGPGVGANFAALVRAVRRHLPLPLGLVHNRRSLVALDNLVDVIATCVDHPAAANEVFLVSDGEDLSTPDLIRRLAAAMGTRALLLPVPPPLLRAAAAIAGRTATIDRLLGSLSVDITKVRTLLAWSPPVGVDEALRRAVREPSQRRC
jgi:UDP-glucose 4-epimerase